MDPGLADGDISGADDRADWVSSELHTDGSGVFALRLDRLGRAGASEESSAYVASDELIAVGLIGAVRELGEHARGRAAASGLAMIRAVIAPAFGVKATAIGHDRGFSRGPLGRPTSGVSSPAIS